MNGFGSTKIVAFVMALCLMQACRAGKNEDVQNGLEITAHRHSVEVNDIVPIDVPEFGMVERAIDSSLSIDQVVENSTGTRKAILTWNPIEGERFQYGIYVVDATANVTYEIHGLPLPWRPFSDPVWATDELLVFDKWSQPRHGIHYAVDVVQKRLLLASPFPNY